MSKDRANRGAAGSSDPIRRLLTLAVVALGLLVALHPSANVPTHLYLELGRDWTSAFRLKSDPYLFWSADHPWHGASGWLACLILYLLHRIGGFPALILFKAALMGGLAGVIVRRARWAGAAASLAFVAIFAQTEGLSEDPFLFSIFLTPLLLLYLLERQEEPGFLRDWRVPTVFLVWANLDRFAILGLAVLVVVLVCDYLRGEQATPPAKPQVRIRAIADRALFAGACVVATAISPGRRGIVGPIEFFTSGVFSEYRERLGAWAASTKYWPSLQVALFAALTAVAVACLLMPSRLVRSEEKVILLLFGALAWMVVWFVPVSSWVIVVVTTRLVDRSSLPASLDRASRGLALLAAGTLSLAVAFAGYPSITGHRSVRLTEDPSRTQRCLAAFLDRSNGTGLRLLVEDTLAPFLIYRYQGRMKLFTHPLIEDPEFTRKSYLAINADPAELSRVAEEFGLDGVLLARSEEPVPPPRLRFLESDPAEWGLAYWDDVQVLYLRRSRQEERLRTHEYRFANPINRMRIGLGTVEQVTAELTRASAECPEHHLASDTLERYRRAVQSSQPGSNLNSI